MKISVSSVFGASLLLTAGASVSEPYCLVKAGDSLFKDDPMPTVTIIYSDTTTITSLAAFTSCEDSRPTPALGSEHSGSPLASPTGSGITVDRPTSVAEESLKGSQSASPLPLASALSSQQPLSALSSQQPLSASIVASPSASLLTQGTPLNNSGVAAPSDPTIAPSGGPNTAIGSAVASSNLSRSDQSEAISTGDGGFGGESRGPNSAATDQMAPTAQLSSNAWATSTPSSIGVLPTAMATQIVATPGAPSPAGPLVSGGSTASRNSTLALSPAATDALQLAQFLKNFGVSLFNSSSQFTASSAGDVRTSTPSTESVANIFLQERTQQDALLKTLHQAGSVVVPPCEYDLPATAPGRALLMSTLKSVEVGLLMTLAESLASEDTSAFTLLSSMAGVAARQNDVLRAQANLNASIASFETPLSATWAYNLLLNYVRPGSCLVELPIPILPTLSVNGSVSAYAQANGNVTFAWDVAGKAAAARSGKSLHIGWINQVDNPIYTSITALGDGRGTTRVPPGLVGTAIAVLTAQPGLTSIQDLTEATLAGPVILNLSL